MRRSPAIEAYLAELASELARHGLHDRRIAREARGHLYARARRFRREGERREQSERQAVACFGAAAEIARDLAAAGEAPARRRKSMLRLSLALASALALATGGVVLGSVALDKPVFGILVSQAPTQQQAAKGGIVYTSTSSTLVKLDPRTLRPVGERLRLGEWRPLVRSPDGSRLVLARRDGARLRFVDLPALKVIGDLLLVPGPNRRIGSAAWLGNDRLLALTQRMGGPYHRQVKGRSLFTVDVASRRVLARRSFSRRRVQGDGVAGDSWVLALGDSDHRLPYLEVRVVRRDGSFRTVRVPVGRTRPGGPRLQTALSLEPSGGRVFLTTERGRVFEVDLASLAVTVHAPRFRASGVRPAAIGFLQVAPVGDHYLGVAGLIREPRGNVSILGGVWLVDTHTWLAHPLDRSGNAFQYASDTVLVYGATVRARHFEGVGVRAYDVSGRRRFSIYPGMRIQRPVIVGDYLHTLVFRPGPPRAVFDLHTGRNLGHLSRPPANLELLDVYSGVAGG